VLALSDRTDATLISNVENYARRINNDNTRPTTFTYNTKEFTDGAPFSYDYQLVTPWRMGASVSYVLREIKDVTKQKGFITADVELVNYKSMSYSSSVAGASNAEKEYFESINADIDQLYKMAFNARIGGELKFKTIMARLGFNYMGSPYQKDQLPDEVKGWRATPSLGLGYRDKGIFFDLTYALTFGNDFHVPYLLVDNIYPLARNRFTNGQVLATVGFKF
jgi:hypothetical protein